MLMAQVLYVIKKYLGIIFILYGSLYAISQENDRFIIPDSLVGKDYEYLHNKSIENYADTITASFYLNAYLTKATLEENRIEKSKGLSYLAYYAKGKKNVIRILEKSLKEIEGIEDKEVIPIYIHIGATYPDYYEYEAGLNCYVMALELSEKAGYKNFQYFIYNNIAKIKEDIGKHDEALELYKKCYLHSKNETSNDSIDYIINLAASYRNVNKHDSASYYYHKIVDASYQKETLLGSIVTINEGYNLYYKKEYLEAEKLLKKGISEMTFTAGNHKHYIQSQLYLGKISNEYYQNKEKTKRYYINIDSLLSTTDLILPETIEVYDFLIDYYEEKKNYKEQLNTINKLLELNTNISSKNIKVADQLHTKFDTPQLLKNKENLIKNLKEETNSFKTNMIYLIICIALLLVLFFFQHNKHKKYKKRFEVIVSQFDEQKKDLTYQKIKSTPKEINIDDAIVIATLERLELFETNEEFLQPNINISIVAKKCMTNTKYLSKIINTHKNKSFINYINDLRIDYILKKLKENTILQRYTIKTISEEAGFNNADSFTKAFKKRTGITPSYYLKNLKAI